MSEREFHTSRSQLKEHLNNKIGENEMGIIVYRDRWHSRLFFWALGVWEHFIGREAEWKHKDGTNLCFYIRVICVWVPLVFLAHVALFSAAVYVLFILPAQLFGLLGFWTIIGIGVAAIGAIILITIIATGIVTGIDEGGKYIRLVTRYAVARRRERREGEPSFGALAKEWVIAKKQKMCPLITFLHPAPVRQGG